MTLIMFGVISTISMTCMNNSILINDEKYLLGLSKIKNLYMQLVLLLRIAKAYKIIVQGIP